jgi:YbbR domain-containing protein
VSVELDVSGMIAAYTYNMSNYTINWPDSIDEGTVSPSFPLPQIKLIVDKMATKAVPVRVNSLKSNIVPIADYIVDVPVIEPAEIRVSGPASVLDSVKYAEVILEERNIDRTVSRTMEYILVDENGAEVSYDSVVDVERIPGEVNVSIPVSKTKSVMLGVDFRDGGGITSAENVNWSIEPESITISGDPNILEGINSIVVKQIDLSMVPGDDIYEYMIPLPNECENLSGIDKATVTLEIKGVQSRTMSVTHIETINADIPAGYELKLINQAISVRIRGPLSEIEQVQPYNIRVVADLAGQTLSGQMSVLAEVHVENFLRVGAVGETKVSLELVPVSGDGS